MIDLSEAEKAASAGTAEFLKYARDPFALGVPAFIPEIKDRKRQMKLWHLKPVDDDSGPWKPWYDKVFGMVVRAKTEADARKAASDEAGCEGRGAWTDPELSSCVELLKGGDPEVIIRDCHHA